MFWKKNATIKTNIEPEWWEEPWKGVKVAYPPGFIFPFLNTPLIVVGYRYDSDAARIHPVMITAYRDSVGVIHEWIFTEHAIDMLVQKVPVKK